MQYTVKEFRASMRKALNDIDAGKRVTIERYGKIYQLLPTDLKEIEVSGIKVVKLEPREGLKQLPPDKPLQEIGTVLVPPVAKNISRDSNGLCKVHATPLDSRGKCLQKGCKYA